MIYSIKSVATGKVLFIPQGSLKNNMPIKQDTWRGGQNQQWRLQLLGGADQGYNYIFSVKSKKCIAASPKAKDDKAEINQYQCNAENHQKWKLIPVNDEQFVIECKNSGKVLTVSDNKIIEDTLNDDESQYWILNEIG